ncbi:ATP-binding protein [Streptomyces hypolithicus]
MQRQVVQLTCRPERASQARDTAAAFLARLDPAPAVETAQSLLVLVSELVTNALRHAGAVPAVRVSADRRSIQVRVEDPSPAHPQDRTPDLTGGAGGFGWPMVQRLARSVTVHPTTRGGKLIQATLAR